MALTKEDILEAVAGLTVMELNDLVKAFEEKFGVSAAAVAASGVWPQRQHIRLGIGADCAGRFVDQTDGEAVAYPLRLSPRIDLEHPFNRPDDYGFIAAECRHAVVAADTAAVCTGYVQFAAIFDHEHAHPFRFAYLSSQQR